MPLLVFAHLEPVYGSTLNLGIYVKPTANKSNRAETERIRIDNKLIKVWFYSW